MKTIANKLTLGIDIGTTKIAVALIDAETRAAVVTESLAHTSDVQGLPNGHSEQAVARIMATLDICMGMLPEDMRKRVVAMGVTGQMHGIVLWSTLTGETSNLITWQDQRCLEGRFIDYVRDITGDATAQSGYGLSTLAWMLKNAPSYVAGFDKCGTIHDYLVYLLTGGKETFTDPSDAASWGMFDLRSRDWDLDKVRRAGINAELLPKVSPAGSVVGALTTEVANRWGLPSGVYVGNAIGDNQASLYGSLTDPEHQMAITVGTGAQLSVVVPSLPADLPDKRGKYEFRPYVGDSYLAVAASLTGGRTLAALARAIKDFLTQMGIGNSPSLEDIQTAMHEQGMRGIATQLRANPSFSGERYDPSLRGSFSNLSFENFTIGDMTAALCKGLVVGLFNSLPKEYLASRREIVGSGNAIRRSALMQQTIREVFNCTLSLKEGSETTACGAALLAADQLR